MTADIKPFVSQIKQNHATRSNVLKQSMYGNVYEESSRLLKRESINSNGCSSRVKSAFFANHEPCSAKDHSLTTKTIYTRFRPVTSHPTTSLLASLYRQQSFAESRNAQEASKLPSILYNRSLMQSSQSNRETKHFSKPTYSSSSPARNGKTNSKRSFHPNERSLRRTLAERKESQNKPTSVSASATWNAVHESILANGQGIFHNQSIIGPSQAITKNSSASVKTFLNRSSFNYVPFFEIRGRGDGASVVDIPSIDVEGKKIEKQFVDPMQISKPKPSTKNEQQSEHVQIHAKSTGEEGHTSKKSDEHSSAKVTESNDDAPNSLISSSIRLVGNDVNKLPTTSKVEKKVRFSGTVTTNKISEEPSYTEALINSLHKSFKQHNYLNTAHRTVVATLGENMDLKDSDMKRSENGSVDASTKLTNEEDYPPFVTPVMKVVVTKRKTPAGAENPESTLSSPRDSHHQLTPQQLSNSASKIIKNQVTADERGLQARPATRPLTTAEVLRKGTQATQRASTAGYARNKEAIAKVVKLIPKRQTVIMPNFSKQPVWPPARKNFSHFGNSYKVANSFHNSTTFSASVQGSNFNEQTKDIKYKPPTLSKDTLKNRLTGGGLSYYFNRDEFRERKFSQLTTDSKKKSAKGELESTPVIALPTTENLSQVAMLSTKFFTDFQPIPSIPDHINFCDPRKTELILHWLEDVNKKRNIESRLKRAGLSKK